MSVLLAMYPTVAGWGTDVVALGLAGPSNSTADWRFRVSARAVRKSQESYKKAHKMKHQLRFQTRALDLDLAIVFQPWSGAVQASLQTISTAHLSPIPDKDRTVVGGLAKERLLGPAPIH